MFTVTIDTNGAAFTIESSDDDNGTPHPGPELARLLRSMADDLDVYGDFTGESPLIDSNGNKVGSWTLTDD